MPNNTQCVAGIPDAIQSAQPKYSTASVKNEELPSSWIKDKASRRKSEETVSFRIALAIASNSNRWKSVSIKSSEPEKLMWVIWPGVPAVALFASRLGSLRMLEAI
ncbi:hypothetical protein B0H13DRAFT_1897858 [Mycena leptocephala]|nr:hypothetical protein B0H13DRAFT_1897858 [Mycena leptocephala]